MKTFKELLEDISNSVNGVAGVKPGDEPPMKSGTSTILRRKFAGAEIFEVSSDTYYKCIYGKKKYSRYDKYVGNDEVGQSIREYGRKNPKASIVLKNISTGGMVYFKKK